MNLLKRATLVTFVAGSGLIFAATGAAAATVTVDAGGQSGVQGQSEVDQSGDQGAKQNDQIGDQGAKEIDQSGDQGATQIEQSGDQGQSGHNGV